MQRSNEQISQLNGVINDKDDDIEQLKQQIKQFEDDSMQKQSLLNMAQAQQQELENKIGENHSVINRLEAELETVSQQFDDLKLEYPSFQDDHQILSDVQETLEYQKRELDDKMEEKNKEMQKLQEKDQFIE